MQVHEPRPQLDHLLRQTRFHLISLSQMADTKANILLGVSSVLLSISFTKITDPRFTGALIVLVAFLLVTIFLALITVIPKVQSFRPQKRSVHDPTYNPLYFGDYVNIPYDEYAQHMEEVLNDSDACYEVMIKEIYYSGVYLMKNKYRYIRLGYVFFFTGLICATLIFFTELLR